MQGAFKRCCSPPSPPTPPPALEGIVPTAQQPPEVLSSGQTTPGWSEGSHSTAPRGEEGEGDEEKQRAGRRSSLLNPKCLEVSRPSEQSLGPERNFLPCHPRCVWEDSAARQVSDKAFSSGSWSEQEQLGQRTQQQLHRRQPSQGGPSWTNPGQGVQRTGGLHSWLSSSGK